MADLIASIEILQANMRPAMLADLAETLGVSSESLVRLGIGWYPLEACWVFPERDAEGAVVGLIRRFKDGKKLSVTGGHRGLTYPLSENFSENQPGYTPGKQNWVHTNSAYPCPICGKTDWCLVSSENPGDPKAVICGRKAEGATRPLGDAGYLHILKPEGQVQAAGSPLPASDLPILLVEGQSDTAAALDLGFIAVGRPSASGGRQALAELLVGRDVVVLGENDSGAGRKGMERIYVALRPHVKSIRTLMPPDTVKDLRQWVVREGLTYEKLLDLIAKCEAPLDTDILERTAPLYLAELWLTARHKSHGVPLIRKYRKVWFRYDGRCYAPIDEETDLRGQLYAFFQDKKYIRQTTKGPDVVNYDPTRAKISDIIDALNMSCPVTQEPPCWLEEVDDFPAAHDIVPFADGLLDVEAFVKGCVRLLPASPLFFCQAILPYNFTPDATCPVFLRFLSEVFPDDPMSIQLLQEWFGYNLVADTSYEKFMMLVGRPGAGKSTVIEAMRAMLGPGQVASTSFDSLTSEFGLHPLLGKLSAILPDAHMTKRGDPTKALEVLKAITGRDYLSVNRKHKEHLSECKLKCRITISVNDLPELPDQARTLERRLLLLHFGQTFAGREDTTLKDRVVTEAAGIALWALEGLKRLRTNGHFTSPASASPVVHEFRRVISPLTEFVDDVCDFEGGNESCFVVKTTIFDAWIAWARQHGMSVGSRTRFGIHLLALYPGIRASRRTVNGNTISTYEGIRLTEAGVKRYIWKEN